MYDSRLKGLVIDIRGTDKGLLLRVKSIGVWLSVRGTTVSGTVLSATEFQYFLCTRYNVFPVNLHIECDGCGTSFGVTNELSCIIGGLVIVHHNEIRDKILYLSRRAFTLASVCVKPLIHQGRTRSEQEIHQGSDKHKDTRGEMMIRGLWDLQVYAIIKVKIGDTDADKYKYEPMKSLLTRWERIKKDKHGKNWNDQRKHFLHFILFQWKVARGGNPSRSLSTESSYGR